MNISEILQGKGIDQETIKAIMDEMKQNKIYLASEENLDIRYNKLKADHDGVNKQLTEANSLIEEMKKSTKGQEELQNKITAYEQQITALQQELMQERINAALKVNLLSAKANDVDYLTFKLREKMKSGGEELKLDESGDISGWNEKLEGLKTQFPTMFESAAGNENGMQVLDPNRLKDGGNGETVTTKEAFRKLNYEQRVALKKSNEKLYNQLAK